MERENYPLNKRHITAEEAVEAGIMGAVGGGLMGAAIIGGLAGIPTAPLLSVAAGKFIGGAIAEKKEEVKKSA